MKIRINEMVSLHVDGVTTTIQPGTLAVEKDKQFFFPDVTKTRFLVASKQTVQEHPSMFTVIREFTDRSVQINEVLRIVADSSLPQSAREDLTLKIQSL